MKGRISNKMGEIQINPDVIAYMQEPSLWSVSVLSEWQL